MAKKIKAIRGLIRGLFRLERLLTDRRGDINFALLVAVALLVAAPSGLFAGLWLKAQTVQAFARYGIQPLGNDFFSWLAAVGELLGIKLTGG